MARLNGRSPRQEANTERKMIAVLDGGMGGELIRRGVIPSDGLWSAQALIDQPEAVLQVHLDYIAAGARIITTNSYSTIPSYLCKASLEGQYVTLTARAGALARRAADESNEDVLVAGSLPPLAESYRADLVPPDSEAQPIYANMAAALAPHVDIFLCETMASAREARNAAVAAKQAGSARSLPVYVSWTLGETPGSGLRSGESIAAALDAVRDLALDGFLFNCTSPEAIDAGLATLAGLTDRPFGGYPNRIRVPDGWTLDNDVQAEHREDVTTRDFVAGGLRAIERGASLYGGCCGIGPDDIAALAQALDARTCSGSSIRKW